MKHEPIIGHWMDPETLKQGDIVPSDLSEPWASLIEACEGLDADALDKLLEAVKAFASLLRIQKSLEEAARALRIERILKESRES